jgi:hypothetical protein
MMRGASGDECGKLLGQEYNRPAEAGVLKKPREVTFTPLSCSEDVILHAAVLRIWKYSLECEGKSRFHSSCTIEV